MSTDACLASAKSCCSLVTLDSAPRRAATSRSARRAQLAAKGTASLLEVRQDNVTEPSAATVAALPQSHAGLPAQSARVVQDGIALPFTVTFCATARERQTQCGFRGCAAVGGCAARHTVKVTPVDAGILSQCSSTFMFSLTSIA